MLSSGATLADALYAGKRVRLGMMHCTRYSSGMAKRVVILQSNYIPWRGYFDLIRSADEFVFYDDVQFTKNDWRNRNRIKTPRGPEWLSVPVGQNIRRTIRAVELTSHDWQQTHWAKLEQNYSKAAHFDEVASWLKLLYDDEIYTHLSTMNQHFIRAICAYLGMDTRFSNAWDYPRVEGRTERLVAICRELGADTYVSGPSAKDYLDTAQFARAGIAIEWFDYAGYPAYTQLWGAFEPQVTILDLLFNCGRKSPNYMRKS